MIRIIFENGEILDCDNIEKIFMEEFEHDSKVIIVGKLLPIGKQDDDLVIDTEGGY